MVLTFHSKPWYGMPMQPSHQPTNNKRSGPALPSPASFAGMAAVCLTAATPPFHSPLYLAMQKSQQPPSPQPSFLPYAPTLERVRSTGLVWVGLGWLGAWLARLSLLFLFAGYALFAAVCRIHSIERRGGGEATG